MIDAGLTEHRGRELGQVHAHVVDDIGKRYRWHLTAVVQIDECSFAPHWMTAKARVATAA